MRSTAAVALLLLFCGGFSLVARGQVAVPELIPGAPRIFATRFPVFLQSSFTPENPAALQWGAPSRLAVGGIDGVSSHAIPGLGGNIDGSYGGLRLVGRRLALAAETTKVSLVSNAPAEESADSVALSFSYPDWIAYGISSDSAEADRGEVNVGQVHMESDRSTFGISLKFGEGFFIGAAVGKEEVLRTVGPITEKLDQDFNMAGIGLRDGGDFVWHLEYFFIHRDKLEDAQLRPRFGSDHSQATVEVGFWDLVFGYSAYVIKGTGTRTDQEIEGFTVDYGYAPFEGLTVTGRFERSTHTITGIEVAVEEINSLTLAWQF